MKRRSAAVETDSKPVAAWVAGLAGRGYAGTFEGVKLGCVFIVVVPGYRYLSTLITLYV